MNVTIVSSCDFKSKRVLDHGEGRRDLHFALAGSRNNVGVKRDLVLVSDPAQS